MGHEHHMITLREMNRGLQEIAFKVGGGNIPEAGSAEAQAMLAKIYRWKAQAENMGKAADSRAGLLNVSYRGQMRGRGPGAYSARQSYRSHMANVSSIKEGCELATETCLHILDMISRHRGLDASANALKDGMEIVKKALEGDSGHQLLQHELTHIVQQPGGSSGGTPVAPLMGGGTLILAAGLALIAMWLDGRRKDS